MKRAAAAGPAIGIDLGGTKIEGVRLGRDGAIEAQRRIASPQGDYAATIAAIRGMVDSLDAPAETGAGRSRIPVGLGIPGSVSKRTGRVQNANSTWLNGRDLTGDLGAALGRPLRIANDANCFALSEAVDGAGAGSDIVLGVILGTGAGSGIVVRGVILDGPLSISGEWGHTALPGGEPGAAPICWCGRSDCLEAWVSGPALALDHARVTGQNLTAEDIAHAAGGGSAAAQATLARHADRLARGLAQVVNIVDPDVIVLGGGLSKLAHLYSALPDLMIPHIFADAPTVRVLPPKWGDASGVRGAAWLSVAE
ncbi:MAG: ROK family protein [Hyphomicrobium sp.]